jgi:hypothetical protein
MYPSVPHTPGYLGHCWPVRSTYDLYLRANKSLDNTSVGASNRRLCGERTQPSQDHPQSDHSPLPGKLSAMTHPAVAPYYLPSCPTISNRLRSSRSFPPHPSASLDTLPTRLSFLFSPAHSPRPSKARQHRIATVNAHSCQHH